MRSKVLHYKMGAMSKMELSRRRTLVAGVLVVVTIVATMFVYVYPLRSYYAQKGVEQQEIERLNTLKKANKELLQQRRDLSTDAEIERIAREQYHLIKPGEEAYLVTGQTPQTQPAK